MSKFLEMAADLRSMAEDIERHMDACMLPAGTITINEAMTKMRLAFSSAVSIGLVVWDYGRGDAVEPSWCATGFTDSDTCHTKTMPTLADAVDAVIQAAKPVVETRETVEQVQASLDSVTASHF